jgi:hypothetical protein
VGVEAVEAGGAAEVADEQGKPFIDPSRQEPAMRHCIGIRQILARIPNRAGALLLAVCFAATAHAAPDAATQRVFSSAEDATAALVKALKANDTAGALAILGPGSGTWVRSGDAVADRAAREHFVELYDQKHVITETPDKGAALAIGPDEWPFAFPLVKSKAGWRFDTEAGKEELLDRRVGQNELTAINTMLAIVDAQREYAAADRNRDGVREYARAFASSPGKRDGLYWQTNANEPPSPLGDLIGRATAEGYSRSKDGPTAYHGYYFRMLKGQGSHAQGGALDYLVRGHMIGGFAVVAYPAQYASSGVMTFIVNHDGVVYQKDLGSATASIAGKMTHFDPAPGWTKAGNVD